MKLTTNKSIDVIDVSPSSEFESLLRVNLIELYIHKDYLDGESFGYWFGKLLYNSLLSKRLIPSNDNGFIKFDSLHYVYALRQLSTGKFRIGETTSLYNRFWMSHGNGYFLKYDKGESFITDLLDFEFIVFTICDKSINGSTEYCSDEETRFSKITDSYNNGFNGSIDGKGHHQYSIWVKFIDTGCYGRIRESDFNESIHERLKVYRVYSLLTKQNYFMDIGRILDNLDLELRFGYPKGDDWWTLNEYIDRPIITESNLIDLI